MTPDWRDIKTEDGPPKIDPTSLRPASEEQGYLWSTDAPTLALEIACSVYRRLYHKHQGFHGFKQSFQCDLRQALDVELASALRKVLPAPDPQG